MKNYMNKQNKIDTGGGCSICGGMPCVNVHGSHWLCGPCVYESITEKMNLESIIGDALWDMLEQKCLVLMDVIEQNKILERKNKKVKK